MNNTATTNKLNEIAHAIDVLVIYHNKGTDQARREVFSRYSPAEVAAYKAAERKADQEDAERSDAPGTY
jgi:hypothetical protein